MWTSRYFRCRMTVFGAAGDLREFAHRAGGGRAEAGPLALDALLPVPDELRCGALAPFGDAWRVQQWGSPRDIDPSTSTFRENTGLLDYEFTTVSGPPLAWVDRVAAGFPDLDFEFSYHWGDPWPGRCSTRRGRRVTTTALRTRPLSSNSSTRFSGAALTSMMMSRTAGVVKSKLRRAAEADSAGQQVAPGAEARSHSTPPDSL